MNIRKIFILLLVLIIEQSVFAQVMRNHGKIVVSGGHMVISGNYQNESTGGIVLNGTIQVTGNWTNNGTTNVIETPGTDGEVVFNGTGTQTIGGTSSNVFDFEKITINSGSVTEVQAGMGVTAYGACTFTDPLVLKSTTTAFRPLTATFINESTVTGNISMELSYTSTGTSAAGDGRGLYFSVPISNATSTIFDVASSINLLWYQDEVARKYVKVTTNGSPLSVAKGYILRTPTSNVFSFTGTPNTAASYTNDTIPRAVATQYYLFGNPYSSVVDWDNMTKSNLSSTIWFNTSTTDGTMVVDTWNSASSVGTNRNGTAFVDGNIAPMQSFWVQCTDVGLTGSLTVSQSNRSHDWGTAPFIKKANGKSTDKDIFRIYLNTGVNLQDETVIVQSESAEDGFGNWDSRKMLLKDGKRGELYTLSPEKINLVIQSFTPVSGDKEIKLGFYAPIAGEYKITTNFDKFQFNQNVYLVDKLLNSTQDLFVNPEYTFTSDAKDDTARFVLRFASAPKVVVSNSISACAPQVVDLTSEAVTFGSDEGLTFSYWTDPKATTAYLTPENAESGTYFIKGTAENGSYFIAGPIEVSINPQPKLAVNSPSAVCEPQTVDLTSVLNTEESTVGLTYTYWTDKDATIPLENTILTNSGTFYVKGTTDAGCYVVSGPIVVKINSKPNLVINNPTAVCEPLTVDLTTEAITNGSTSGLQFTYWADANATVSYLTPATASTGNYYIKGVDENGCSSISGPLTVAVNPKPSVVLTNPTAVCEPLTVDITTEAITNGSSSSLQFTYWTDENAAVSYLTPATASTGNYYIKGVDENGCSSISGPLTVTVNPKPSLILNSPAAVCEPLTVDLTTEAITNGSTSGLQFTYWTDENAAVSYLTPATASTGNYYIKGVDENGCSSISGPLTVAVNPKPSVVLTNPTAVCEPLTVDITTEAITNGSSSSLQFTYWTDENATVSYSTPTVASAGNYYIKGVDSNGCSSISGPLTVTVNPKPSVVLTNPSPVVYPATVDITNTAITFGSTEGLIYSYWLDSDATLIYGTPQTATAGDYFIKGTVDLTGCYTIAGPLTVTITTSDNIDLFDQIKVYSYDKNIVFENCAENSIVSIYDITGKNIYNGMVKSRKETVPFNFNTGIYIVNVRSAQNVKSFKVLLR